MNWWVSLARRLAYVLPLCAGCAPATAREVIVPATDYAFQLADSLPAGPVEFRLDNRGKVPHEMALGLLKAGVSADSVMAFAAQGGDPGDLTDGVVGILIANGGTTSLGTLRTELLAGRTYMMLCNFKDNASAPPHIAMGMVGSFVVN